ncbi:MAG: hypothetical protein WKF73_15815 [Nocardioidaceae bacterium]
MPRAEDHAAYISPTQQSAADLGDAALRAATGLLRHSGRQRRRVLDLQRELRKAQSAQKSRRREARRGGLPRRGYLRCRRFAGRVARRLHLR